MAGWNTGRIARPPPEQLQPDDEAQAAREHGGERRAVHAERGDRAPAQDHERVEHEIEQHRSAQQVERRAGVTRTAKGGGDDEVTVDQEGTDELDDEEVAGELGNLAVRIHEPEDRRQSRDPRRTRQ